jgi:hypothetical protein
LKTCNRQLIAILLDAGGKPRETQILTAFEKMSGFRHCCKRKPINLDPRLLEEVGDLGNYLVYLDIDFST